MRYQKSKLHLKTKQKELLSLKKLPLKKPLSKTSQKKHIVVDAKARKEFSSILEIIKRKIPNAAKSKMPTGLRPMLASLVDEAFTDSEWQFELKLDGYRTLAYLDEGKVDLRSRKNNSFNKQFDSIQKALEQWKINAVIDGEVVVLNDKGVPDFNKIQLWDTQREGHLVYYVFDLLWIDGLNIMDEPLHLRREILKQLMPESGIIRYSDHIDDIGTDFFEIAKKNNLEGIVAKKKDSVYIPDSRAKTWLKIKIEEKHEAIICGYTKKRDSERVFSSLLLGIYEKEQLKFIGQAGTGFTERMQEELMKKMKPFITKKLPFDEKPSIPGSEVVWLKPLLVCEVKYTELTNEGLMRHASFQGLREDKKPRELNNEEGQSFDTLRMTNNRLTITNQTPETAKGVTKNSLRTEVQPEEENRQKNTEDPFNKTKPKEELINTTKEQQLVIIDGHDLKLTNLKKIYWPKEKITKGQMLNYYFAIAPYILPYMKDRPQSLNRFPNGINGESFYHKNMGGKVDKWLKTFKRFSESSREPKDFLICTDAASLIYMANLGCIEMNPWHSRVQSPLYPDWSVVDLDPGEISFDKVIETAQVVHQILNSLHIPSFPKTSGSTGIHIYIPLGAKYNYEQSKQLAELIANLVHDELPSFTSLVRDPRKRKDKIYIDYLQNRPIQTICAPYSVRPKPGATVSAPLHWDEVKKGLKISNFTMKNILERVKTEGDLFDGVLGKGIDLNKILKGLSSLI